MAANSSSGVSPAWMASRMCFTSSVLRFGMSRKMLSGQTSPSSLRPRAYDAERWLRRGVSVGHGLQTCCEEHVLARGRDESGLEGDPENLIDQKGGGDEQ